MANKPVLGYWNIRGLGQPIRFLLAYLNVDFEDKQYDVALDKRDLWFAEKQKLNTPFPNLPYLVDGSLIVTESQTILRYLCRTRKPEMLGKTTESQTIIDTVNSFACDFIDYGLVRVCYEFTEERLKAYKETEPKKLALLSNYLNGKQFVGGDELTYADFMVYEVLYDIVLYDSKCLDNFPDLQGYMKRFESLPAIKKCIESPDYIKSPVFMPEAIIKL